MTVKYALFKIKLLFKRQAYLQNPVPKTVISCVLPASRSRSSSWYLSKRDCPRLCPCAHPANAKLRTTQISRTFLVI